MLVPLKYIDVTRTTHTNLDVKHVKRIDDCWNIDGSRDLSDPWTGFTQFTLLEEKPPDRYKWSGRRLTRKQLTSRPDHSFVVRTLLKLGKNAKVKDKYKWSNEKIHLDHARKLRGIYFVDSEDKELKETIMNGRKNLETSVLQCLHILNNCGSGASTKLKQNLRVIWKPVNLPGCVWEIQYRMIMRALMQEKATILQHYNLVHKIIPLPQAIKIPVAKAALDKEWEKLEKILAWNLTKVKSKKQVIDEARASGATVHFASLMDMSFDKC